MANKKKQANKKKDIKNVNKIIATSNELASLLKIVFIISGVLILFYFITVIIDKRINNYNYKTEDKVAVIQYDKIIVGEILNRSEDSYYVLVEAKDDSYVDLYKQYLSIYSGKEGSLKYYTVDLDDVFNINNIADENYIEGNDCSKYKFATTSLLKIEQGQLVAAYSDLDSITQHLSDLIK